MNKIAIIALALSVGISADALACSFDTDCEIGNICLKKSGSFYGVCAGGMSPGNRSDRQPVYSPLDTNHTTGNTCQFDIDCGLGSSCVKGRGMIDGVCVH